MEGENNVRMEGEWSCKSWVFRTSRIGVKCNKLLCVCQKRNREGGGIVKLLNWHCDFGGRRLGIVPPHISVSL